MGSVLSQGQDFTLIWYLFRVPGLDCFYFVVDHLSCISLIIILIYYNVFLLIFNLIIDVHVQPQKSLNWLKAKPQKRESLRRGGLKDQTRKTRPPRPKHSSRLRNFYFARQQDRQLRRLTLMSTSFFRYFILDYLICNGLFPEMYQGIEFDPLAR